MYAIRSYYERHADWLISAGVHGLVVTGTSGEFIALTLDERRLVITGVIAAASYNFV